MKTHVFRLHPGQLLREEIEKFAREKNIQAGVIITCVGNVSKAVLRMANAKIVKTWEGTFEIISLVGTVEAKDSHLHLSISDEQGDAFGGHLKNGTVVGVTAEMVIGEVEGMQFSREFDDATGYNELRVKSI